MNMKVKCKEEENNEHPMIMKSTKSGSVYIMIDKNKGTKLMQGKGSLFGVEYPIGTYAEDWDEDCLVKFKGKVTIDCTE